MGRLRRGLVQSAQLIPFICIGVIGLGGPVSSESLPDGVSYGGDRIRNALEVLRHVPAGREILGVAERRWELKTQDELLRVFKWGDVSRTDAVLTRHFNPTTGKEQRERKVFIYLRRKQAFGDLVLDIAHELTHATAKQNWDPYDPELTPGKYIWTAIEGEGGEVDALVTECRVGRELEAGYGVISSRCQRYVEDRVPASAAHIEKDKVTRDFYRVGKWRAELLRKLGSEGERFPMLSADSPQLFSSTGQAPYPVALLREFEELTEIACENTRRRMSTLAVRAPSSNENPNRASVSRFLARRCPESAPL